MEIKEFGKKIKALRDNNGYTQEWVSDKIGTTRQTLAKWENGATLPDIEMACKIADFYKVSLDELTDRKIIKSHKANTTYADIFRILFSSNINISKLSLCETNIVIVCIYISWKQIYNLSHNGSIDEDTYSFTRNNFIDKFEDINFTIDKEKTIQIIAPYAYRELSEFKPCSIELIIKVLTSTDTFNRTYVDNVTNYEFPECTPDPHLNEPIKQLFTKFKPYVIEDYNTFLEWLGDVDDERERESFSVN